MLKLGNVKPLKPDDPLAELQGEIRTLGFSGRISIARDVRSSSPNAPSHRVYVVDENGEVFEIGSAWTNTAKRGVRMGEEFLSVHLDAPSLVKPISFAVFKNEDGTWSAIWRRRQVNAA